jgi:hypothetical protein
MSAALELRTTSPVFAASRAAMRFPPLAALFYGELKVAGGAQPAALSASASSGGSRHAGYAPRAKGAAFASEKRACCGDGVLWRLRLEAPLRKSASSPETGVVKSSGNQHVESERRRASSAAQPSVRSQVICAKSGTGRAGLR